MKLRLLGNKVRFRLSEPEVYALSSIHQVQAFLPLSPMDSGNLRYAIYCSKDFHDFSMTFDKNELKVNIPLEEVRKWADTDTVGIESQFMSQSGEMITLLIEKDFQCLSDRGEDETKLYPNPNDKH